MFTSDERKQHSFFQADIAMVVDQFLAQGMDTEKIKEILRDEANSDLDRRRKEIEASSVCISPDCKIETEFGRACEHSCPNDRSAR